MTDDVLKDDTAIPAGDGPDDPTPADAVPGDEVADDIPEGDAQ